MADTPQTPPVVTPAEEKTCGCGEKLKAEIEKLTKERDAASQNVVRLQVQLAEAPKRAKLAAEAETLGVPVEASDECACIEKKLAVARAVEKKLAAERGVQRHTQTNLREENADADSDSKVLELFARGQGISLSQ